jgi:hypothetical protein
MSERTIMAVVSDMRRHGLTVELQILVDELVMLVADVQARNDAVRAQEAREEEKRATNRERMRTAREAAKAVRARAAQFSTVQHTPSPFPPMINNSTPLSPSRNISIKSPPAEPLFEDFWGVYPRKVGKGAARKAYRHALTRASHAEILAGAKRYAASKPDPEFTKHPTTWLNADCWLDEGKVLEFRTSPPQRSWAEIKAEREAKEKSQ